MKPLRRLMMQIEKEQDFHNQRILHRNILLLDSLCLDLLLQVSAMNLPPMQPPLKLAQPLAHKG